MCGIVGAVAQRDVTPILLEGLKRLEYRGYDSAGIAVFSPHQPQFQRVRVAGKVKDLVDKLQHQPLSGTTGIAHTRWATHGAPEEHNAHPHCSVDEIALVHNGIIENYEHFRKKLEADDYEFSSETDSEVATHLIHYYIKSGLDFLAAVQRAINELEGAFALAIIYHKEPQRLIAARKGCPLIVGVGIGENFVASDPLALLPVTQQFIYLEEGDIADVTLNQVTIYHDGQRVERHLHNSTEWKYDSADRGHYRHYMLKEIFEQPMALMDTVTGRLSQQGVMAEHFGVTAKKTFTQVEKIHITACGTSYHAGLIGRYWIEQLLGIPCYVEIASEYRYRPIIVEANTLFVTLSQSGETADTLAALRKAKQLNYLSTLAICNVPYSSLVRESDLTFMTQAGAEIGVASTKAFTTQLVALLLLTLALGRSKNKMTPSAQEQLTEQIQQLPTQIDTVLQHNDAIKQLSTRLIDKHHALFLGRGIHYPVAMEGALKMKEISYIHAEAYPAGELKHGPLALVDNQMPVIAVAPYDELLEKLKSNLQEVRARGGELIIFTDKKTQLKNGNGIQLFELPTLTTETSPIIYTIPLQLLAYHIAVLKGTDVDQPRNLAKSVTVE